VAVAMLIAAAIGGEAYTRRHDNARRSATGTLVVTTPRAGATVLVDDVAKGITPLTVSVATGRHILELRDGLEVRVLPITVAGGTVLSQYLELQALRPTTGGLQVRTQPAGAQVAVDGVARGRSPITFEDVVAGEHTVVVTGDHGAITQTVTVGRDVASVSISFDAAPAAALAAGWIVLSSPIAVQVFEHGRLMGSTETDRVILPAGTHQLEMVNAALGYHASRTVQIAPGKVALVNVDVPNGALSLNAAPWAEVWLDGAPLGATPIGNVTAAVGTHQVLFRHPTLGEQRRTIAVPVGGVTRLSVDLRTK
jgi:PEGA domain